MLEGLLVLMAIAAAAIVAVVCVVAVLCHVVIGLILLPFRLLAFVVWLPLLIVKTMFAAIVGVFFVIPFILLTIAAVALAAMVAVVGALAVPLLPVLAIGGFVWLLVKASARPAAI